MAAGTNDLGRDPVGRLIFRMALPTMTAQIVNALYNIVDRIYIGHIPDIGKEALAGIGVTFPIVLLTGALLNLIGVGGSTRAGIAMGEQDDEKAEQILGTSAAALALLGVLFSVLLQTTKVPILLAFGASERTLGYAVEYLKIYLLGTVPTMLALGLNPMISAQGYAGIAMCTTMIGAVLNIALDPLLIFGLNMGISGAAAATAISQFVSALWVVGFLQKRGRIRLKRNTLKIEPALLGLIATAGASPFVMQFTEGILSVAFNASLQRYGGDVAVGAFTIASSATQTMVALFNGLTQGIQPIISYNYGANQPQRVRQTARISIWALLGLGVAIWFAMECCPEMFVLLFNRDPELVSFASWMIRIYVAGFILIGIQHGCQYIFVALGQTTVSLSLALLRKIVLLIPMIYILPHFFRDQVFGVLVAEPVADIIAVSVTGAVFFRRFEKILKERDLQCRIRESG